MEIVYDFDGDFYYEVNTSEVISLAAAYYANFYGNGDSETIRMFKNLIYDELIDYSSDEEFMSYLKEYFEDDAREMNRDCMEYLKDPYGYYGVSRSDFI